MTTVVLACCMEISRLYSAFFVSPVQLDAAPKWKFFDQISYMKYGYIGLCLNEYNGAVFQCRNNQKTITGDCLPGLITRGEDVAKRFGYDRYTISYCAGCMVAYIIICRLASYLALRFIKM